MVMSKLSAERSRREAEAPVLPGQRQFVTLILLGAVGHGVGARAFEMLGLPVGILRSLLLAVAVLCVVHLLIGLATTGVVVPSRALLLLAPSAAVLITSVAKAEYGDVVSPAITAAALLCFAAVPRPVLAGALSDFLLVTLSISFLFSIFYSASAIPGRDFLPLVIDGRAGGIFGHPNMYGLHAGLALLLYLMDREIQRGKLLAIVAVLGLAAAASQTALVATLLGCAPFVLHFAAKRWGRTGAAVAMILVGAGVARLLSSTGLLRSAETGEIDLTFTSRTIIWRALTSVDVGIWGLTDSSFDAVVSGAYGVGSAHNTWLEAWARAGVLGVAGVVLYVVYLMSLRRTELGSRGIVSVALFLGVVSMMEGVLLSYPLVLPVTAAVLSIGSKVHRPMKRSDEPGRVRAKRW